MQLPDLTVRQRMHNGVSGARYIARHLGHRALAGGIILMLSTTTAGRRSMGAVDTKRPRDAQTSGATTPGETS